MKILALIPARGGSKRLPGKNIRLLGGRPLIAWSVDIVQGVPEICDVMVSTDDPVIASVAREAGALVPWLRPAELATDTAGSVDVALHAVDWYQREHGAVDGLLLLQPTTPFRSRDTVRRGVTLFRDHHHQPVYGVSPTHNHPLRCFSIDGSRMRPFIKERNPQQRSQDFPPAYVENGLFYLIAPGDLRRLGSFFSDDAVPLESDDPREQIDIDTEWDWQVAETALRSGI